MADVKFSELAALTTPASADVLAIVDTDASTSKKITIDSLFGVVPVNIAVDDATDTTSATTGSIQTDGGIGAVKALWVGTTATAVGQVTSHAMSMRLGNAAGTTTTTLTSTAASSNKTLTLPNATDTLVGRATTDTLTNKTLTSPSLTTPTITTSFTIGSATITEAELEIIDGALCTTAELNAVADGSTSVGTTAVAASDGIVTNDGGTMQQTTAATFDTYFAATTKTLTNKTLTSPVLTTPQINDSSSDHQYVFVASELAADRNVTLPLLPGNDEFTFNAMAQTLTNKTITAGLYNTSIQAGTNAADVVLNQFDGNEVARIFDGGLALTDTDAATRKGGFGHRRPVIDIDASGGAKAVTLTDKESGALIKINASSSYTAAVTLPGVGADSEGVYFDFVLEADNGSGVFTVQTAAADSNIFAYGVTVAAIGSDVAGGDVLTIAADATKGTKVRLTAAFGSGTTSAILWIAEYYQPAGTAPAVA